MKQHRVTVAASALRVVAALAAAPFALSSTRPAEKATVAASASRTLQSDQVTPAPPATPVTASQAAPNSADQTAPDPNGGSGLTIQEIAKTQGISVQQAQDNARRQRQFSDLVDVAAKHVDYFAAAEWNANTESGRISMTTATPTELYTALVNQGRGVATVERTAARSALANAVLSVTGGSGAP